MASNKVKKFFCATCEQVAHFREGQLPRHGAAPELRTGDDMRLDSQHQALPVERRKPVLRRAHPAAYIHEMCHAGMLPMSCGLALSDVTTFVTGAIAPGRDPRGVAPLLLQVWRVLNETLTKGDVRLKRVGVFNATHSAQVEVGYDTNGAPYVCMDIAAVAAGVTSGDRLCAWRLLNGAVQTIRKPSCVETMSLAIHPARHDDQTHWFKLTVYLNHA